MDQRGVDLLGFQILRTFEDIGLQLLLRQEDPGHPAQDARLPHRIAEHPRQRGGRPFFKDPDHAHERQHQAKQRDEQEGQEPSDHVHAALFLFCGFILVHRASAFLSRR